MNEGYIPEAKADDDNAQVAGIAILTVIVRGVGALFMLAAPVIGYNFGGIAEKFGFDEGTSEIVGVALLVIGLVDFFVMPQFFKGLLEKRGISTDGNDNSPWPK
jgi:hypothetical protein